MKRLLTLTSLGEGGMGTVLFLFPATVVRILFGSELVGVSVVLSRIAAIALVGLGVACWPRNPARQQLYGMLVYSTFVMLYLISVGIHGAHVGVLLWPAVALHAVLTIVLVAVGFREANRREV